MPRRRDPCARYSARERSRHPIRGVVLGMVAYGNSGATFRPDSNFGTQGDDGVMPKLTKRQLYTYALVSQGVHGSEDILSGFLPFFEPLIADCHNQLFSPKHF